MKIYLKKDPIIETEKIRKIDENVDKYFGENYIKWLKDEFGIELEE